MRRGQALIDSALAIVVLLIVVLAIVDFAQIVYTQQAISERVREVTRMASVQGLDDREIVRQVVGRRGGVALKPDQVHVRRKDGSVRVSVTGYRYTLVSAWGSGSIEGREIAHTEPFEPASPGK